MKNKQKAPVVKPTTVNTVAVNPTTNTVPLANLSEDELDMVSGGFHVHIHF